MAQLSAGELALFSFGVVAGGLLVTNGFSEPHGRRDLKNSQRLRNGLWLAGGFLSSLSINYRGLNLDLQPLAAAAAYGTGAACGAILCLSVVCLSYWTTVRLRNRKVDGPGQIDFPSVFREYIHYGKEAADIVLHEAESRSSLFMTADFAAQRRLENTISERVSVAILAVNAHLRKTSQERAAAKAELVDTLVETACSIVRDRLGGVGVIRGSYMRNRPMTPAATLPATCLFAEPHFSGYTSYLETVSGGGLHAAPPVIIPVAGRPADHQMVLPGAPEAVITLSPTVIGDLSRISFRRDVSKTIQRDVSKFFAGRTYVSLASIAVSDGRIVHGVLNIESDRKDLIERDDDTLSRVLSSLSPLASLLCLVEA